MCRRQGGVVEALPRQRAGPEVLDHDVARRDELIEQRTAARVLEVQRDALLVPVDAEKVRALRSQKRRSPVSRVVAAARLFDLYDARAEIREHHRAVRPGEHARQIKDGRAGQRSHATGLYWLFNTIRDLETITRLLERTMTLVAAPNLARIPSGDFL